ncbi:MAG: hypothetical protein AAFX06_18875 [Planctomycetota bacterium]
MKFRLSTALLLVTTIALGLANLLSWRDAAQKGGELDQIRTEFGVIERVNDNRTHVRSFQHPDYVVNPATLTDAASSFRIAPAANTRYKLNFAEITGIPLGVLPDVSKLAPDISVPIQVKEPDEMVLICQVEYQRMKPPRSLVEIDGKLAIDFIFPGDWSTIRSRAQARLTRQQIDTSPTEPIELLWWASIAAKRGFVLWLEPVPPSVDASTPAVTTGPATTDEESL